MPFSELQKFILKQNLMSGDKMAREGLLSFYVRQGKAKRMLQTKIITRSVESLIDRGLLLGYGVRTPHKWFIHEIRLTTAGRRAARELLGRQLSLPLRKTKIK